MNSMRPIMESWRTHLIEDMLPDDHILEVLNAEQQRLDELHGRMEEMMLLEFDLSDIGHIALDIGGLFPGAGEAADLANAAWYAGEGEYFMAALSVIAMIPIVGDLIGKGGKLVTYIGKAGAKGAGKAGGFLAKTLAKHLPKISAGMAKIAKNPTIGKFVKPMLDAIKKFIGKAGSNPKSAEAVADLQKAMSTKAATPIKGKGLEKLKDIAQKAQAKGSQRRARERIAGVGGEEEQAV
jgi:hypothetical protein